MLQFLAEHHLSGGGHVHVAGEMRCAARFSDRQTTCQVELDVIAPHGVINHNEYRGNLDKATSNEERALIAARGLFDWTSDRASSATLPLLGKSILERPCAASKTTPSDTRRAILRWLLGGTSPASVATATSAELAADAFHQHGRIDCQVWHVKDIEDLAGTRKPREARQSAEYSEPSDDPRLAMHKYAGIKRRGTHESSVASKHDVKQLHLTKAS
eukprot:1033524-Amphidinium_carterae.1